MSSSGHHHRSHRKKNRVASFFNRLLGKSKRRTHHKSSFPGIHLPEDYKTEGWQYRGKPGEEKPVQTGPATEEQTKDFSGNVPEIPQSVPHTSSPHKKSAFISLDRYLKRRAIRREERIKEKIRRDHHRRSKKEYRKLNKGRGLGQRLLGISEEGEDGSAEKKVRFFSQRNPVYRNLTITVNSALVFLTTYVLVFLFYWLASMLVASWYGLDSTLYYYDLKFNDHSQLWTRFNILLVTGIPPFFCLFLALFLFRVVFKQRRFVGLQKLFILWSSFHLFNHFFGAFPMGIVTDEGFGYVAAWMFMNTAFKFLFSLVSLFVLGLIGFYSAQHILETSDSLHRTKPENRVSFIFFQAALPWLIGTVVLLLVRTPHNFDFPYETLMLFTTVFLVIPPFFNEKVKPQLNLLKIKKKRNINFSYLILMIALLAFLRIMLGIGLHFVIEINISISPGSA